MKCLRHCVVVLALLAPSIAHGVQPDEILADHALEARARNLSHELRCMVCQNQSIDDSEAPLARDLRLLVRERLKAGDSDAQVLAFLTSRYGDFVLLNPRFGWRTLLLWLIPAGLLLGGAAVLAFAIRNRRGSVGAGTALSAAEEARIAKLLDEIDRPASRERP